jgi:hypothetical protein
MGQRAFRGRLADSIINKYLHNNSENSAMQDYSTSGGTSIDESYFQGKLVDLNLEFNIDSPLSDILDINTALSKGVINATIPKGTKIKNLNLVIKSSLFGEGRTHLHSNLYVLFGSHFYRDIGHINIKLFNHVTKKQFNDRKTINSILDFMCFKTIKVVHINNSLLYYVIPEYSQFAIVLAYKDINFYELSSFNFEASLEDLLFHPYCLFERNVENFMRCLNAIERTVPKEVNNIILPVVYFNNLNPENFGNLKNENLIKVTNNGQNLSPKRRKIIFRDFLGFIKEIFGRFKIMSLEFKVKFNKIKIEKNSNENSFEDREELQGIRENLENLQFTQNFENIQITENNLQNGSEYTENITGFQLYLNFVECIIIENLEYLKNFTYSYLSFNFEEENLNTPEIHDEILSGFQKLLKKYALNNVTLAHHISFKKINPLTNLEDPFEFYDFVHFNKNYSDKISSRLKIIKEKFEFKEIYKRKVILDNLMRSMVDYSKLYKYGRLDFSTELVKNKKIVPFEVYGNNVMVFTN